MAAFLSVINNNTPILAIHPSYLIFVKPFESILWVDGERMQKSYKLLCLEVTSMA